MLLINLAVFSGATPSLAQEYVALDSSLSTQPTPADTPTFSVLSLQHKATALKLWQDPTWKALLHYNQGGTLRDRQQSYIDSADFFFAADGKTNLKSEMLASIEHLFSPLTHQLVKANAQGAQTHVRCDFTARFRFLYERLIAPNEHWKAALATCTDYNNFITRIAHKKIYLIFPGPYLNAPSSMFGHTLLRIGKGAQDDSSGLLSNAITFSANIPDKVSALDYIGKGLFGGFPGYYNLQPYFSKIQEYNNEENRDIWEYELAIPEADINRLMQHVWDIRKIRFDYYYLDENCSYRLLELLSIIKPNAQWVHAPRLAELPINTIKAIEREGLVKRVRWRPSSLEKIRQEIDTLSAAEKSYLQRLLESYTVNNTQLALLSPQQQGRTLDTAFKLYKYKKRKHWHEKAVSQYALGLLKQRAVLPGASAIEYNKPLSPESMHATKRASLSWLETHPHSRSGISMSMRYAYHDLLDNNSAANKDFSLEALNLKLFVDKDSHALMFQEFKLFDVRSLSPRTEFIKPLAWEFEVGIADHNLDYRLSAFANGGAGASFALSDEINLYLLAGGDLYWLENSGLQLNLTSSMGIYHQADKLSWEGALKYIPSSTRSASKGVSLTLGMQYHLNNNWGLRANFEQQLNDDFEQRNNSNFNTTINYYF